MSMGTIARSIIAVLVFVTACSGPDTSTVAPTLTPASTPTLTPNSSPTLTPNSSPTPTPANSPTPTPTSTPTPTPTSTPTPTPTPPPLVLEVVPRSPIEVSLTWSYTSNAPVRQELYRDGELIATPSRDQTSYGESDLSPNRRYEYRIVLQLDDGSTETTAVSSVTLAYPPLLAGPINVDEHGFTLAIVDESNPLETTYQVTVSDGTEVIISDWGTSRCRVFDGLRPGRHYTFAAVAKNLDGTETDATRWMYNDGPDKPEGWWVQGRTGNDDPWVVDRINAVASVYGLTQRARNWMLSDIRVEALRNVPGYAGYIAPDLVRIGRPAGLHALLHELMHGFFEHWDGLREPCDVMNVHTFKRDFAQFMLGFKQHDESGQSSPWEAWRPFYNYFVRLSIGYSGPDGESVWDALAQGKFDELWNAMYHVADTDIPRLVAGNLSLVPPPLQPYFEGFIDERNETTWRDELSWYNRLLPHDKYLWDGVFGYGAILWASPDYLVSESGARTSIPDPLRQQLRDADRRRLIDFVNTLGDLSCDEKCEAFWDADFRGWTIYVMYSLLRTQLYLNELTPDLGIELSPDNLDAVRGVLGVIADDLFCGPAAASDVRSAVDSATGISEPQRAAFLQMIEVRERTDQDWFCP